MKEGVSTSGEVDNYTVVAFGPTTSSKGKYIGFFSPSGKKGKQFSLVGISVLVQVIQILVNPDKFYHFTILVSYRMGSMNNNWHFTLIYLYFQDQISPKSF